ncbi:MAG TPA: FUSC family membrane protein [Cyclobacteriaceae bacterium]|nr:FUSC family membrane protein [Cyclobacteriaceae bacterium]
MSSINSILRFLKSADFSKALVLAMAILIVLGISYWYGNIEIGVSLTMGMFISAPANFPGSNRHRVNGMLAATVLGMLVTVFINIADQNLWILSVVMAILIFLVSYLSVFGFRASLVSFSGLSAIIFSFAHPQEGYDMYIHTGLIGLGGLWYLLFSLLVHIWTHKSHTTQLMAECMDLTATYLRTRGEFALNKGDVSGLEKKLFELQTTINTHHESLREILLSSRRDSGNSNFARRQVLILIELIDILELAIGNLPHVFKMQQRFKNQSEQLQPFVKLIFVLAEQLSYLSHVMGSKQPLRENNSIETLLVQAEQSLAKFRQAAFTPEAYEEALLLQNIYDYLRKQSQKILVIQKVIYNLVEQEQLWSRTKDSSKFITTQDYDRKTLTENFNFDSPIFKHSLRLTVTVLVGFAIGIIFPFQNAYWILLTIIVIMRPGYTLTKQRSKHRLYGTLIGASIAVAVVFITQNEYIYGVMALASFILGFALVQKNYKSSAIFITLNIVLVYALLKSDPLDAIQFRVLDTLTGAVLAFVANLFFWPSWEFLNIREFVNQSIAANRDFLKAVEKSYREKNNADPSYKLHRKSAFLAIGNLNAAFQRMTQEPKQKQKDLDKVYEVVVLNNTFLSLTASLGTYIRNNKTTEASSHFANYMASISSNLDLAIANLYQKSHSGSPTSIPVQEAQQYLDLQYQQLVDQYPIQEDDEAVAVLPRQLQEVKLISDQLKWLLTLSENIKATARTIDLT